MQRSAPTWRNALPEAEAQAHAGLVGALRPFLDALAAARPGPADLTALAEDLRLWTARLGRSEVCERDQVFGRLNAADRGQTLTPAIAFTEQEPDRIAGTTLFGRYFLGGNGAAHGRAVSLMFDEVFGRLANGVTGPISRTAFLRTDFRSITPIDTILAVTAQRISVEGRKTVMRAELKNGPVLCAEAEALFVALRPGQP